MDGGIFGVKGGITSRSGSGKRCPPIEKLFSASAARVFLHASYSAKKKMMNQCKRFEEVPKS